MFLSGFLLNFLIQKRRESAAASVVSPRAKKFIALIVFAFAVLVYGRFSDEALLFSAPIYAPGFFIGAQTMIILAACFLIYHHESWNSYHITAINWKTITENPLRALEIFGILTYGTYIWHMPVMESFDLWYFNIHNNDKLLIVKFLYTFILAIVASSITYYLIEKRVPALRLKRL
jgi:peptidoglycan/LPS O-acetylase OafA/YrhL